MSDYWKSCSTCKNPIQWGARYYICSVSTCNRARIQRVFCKLSCWDAHVPLLNHREAWAEEKTAPVKGAMEEKPRRRIVRPGGAKLPPEENEILIVTSRLKKYVKDKHDMSTSADVLEQLSREVRRRCDEAARYARREGRKTLKARDFKHKP